MDFLRFINIVIVCFCGHLLVNVLHVDSMDSCPQKCSNSCIYDNQWEMTEARCSDVFISSLPDTLTSLRLYDAVDASIVPGNIFISFLLSGKTDLQVLKLENYNIHSLMGQTFLPCLNLESLDLSKNQISSISDENFAGLIKLRYLNLNRNSLSQLGSYSFRHLSELRELYVAVNYIQEIEEHSFDGLRNIVKIDLQNNNISVIHPNALNHLTTLEDIDLQNNNLTRLDANVFANMTNLRQVNLQTNKILTLDPLCMLGTSLTMLNLVQNEIQDIPTEFLQNIGNLNLTVNLARNNITALRADAFNGVVLRILYLVSNQIGTINNDALRNSFILTLDIQQNLLHHIPEGLQTHINQSNELLLSNNPWSCDCNFQWVKVLLRPDVVEPTCAEPVSYHGNKLSEVLDDLKILCGKPQVALPAPSKALPIPPRQNPIIPALYKATTTTAASTTTTITAQSTQTPGTLITSPPTVTGAAKASSLKGDNPIPAASVAGIIAGVVVLAIMAAILLKHFVFKAKVTPDPFWELSRPEVNHKQHLKYTPSFDDGTTNI